MRWDLGGRDLDTLLEEAREVKGESLWNDAWRRLKANKVAYAALIFLAGVGVIALFAPLLPIPSPIALELQEEPLEPDLSSIGNHRWKHRMAIGFDVRARDEAFDPKSVVAMDELGSVIGEAVASVSGHEPHAAWTIDDRGSASLELSLPHERSVLDSGLAERVPELLEAVAPGGALTLESGGVAEVSLTRVEPENGYWSLNLFDRGMLVLRHRLFGFWQTGAWLGTDSKGRDLLSRIVWGSRISIQVALAATACSLLIGVGYGALSGYLGGRVDNAMMRLVDVLYSVPFIFVVIFFLTVLNEYRTELAGVGIDRMVVFYIVVGAIYWLTMARVVRGQVLSLKNSEFIEAARVLGASVPRIVLVHLIPNVLSIVIVYLTLTIPAVMLFESFLSFLGLGVEPPRVSWGRLAVDSVDAISAIKVWWWLVAFPAAAMGSTLLALNILGDGLRDALDPKLRGKD